MKRMIFLLILAAIGAYQLAQNNEFRAMIRGLRHDKIDQARIAASRTSLGYQLKEEHWIEFPLPKNIERLKLITQATIPKEMAAAGAVFTYGIDYQIIGEDGDIPLYQDRYHHTTRVSRFIDEAGGEPYTASMYLDPELIPADGRVLTLNSRIWAAESEAKSIKIRFAEPQAGLPDALLRIYQLEHSTEPEDLADWQRLSIYKRERLARGNVYPHGFLSDQEKANLLSNRWQPLGPMGIAGVDYDVRRLYTLKDVSDTTWVWQEQDLLPDIAADRVMTFSTGADCGWLRLSFTRLPGVTYQPDEPVELNWYGSSIDERDHKLLAMSNEIKTVTTVGSTPGLLELRSTNPYMVTFEEQLGEQWVHWHPERVYAITHLFGGGNPVEFKIAHHDSPSTPIRITLRAPHDVAEPGDFTVSYELLGSENIGNELPLTTAFSPYDRIVSRGEKNDVSEPSVFYLQVPTQFQAIRFTSPRPTLISLATRSPHLSHQTRVPIDVGNYTRTDPNRMSAWFAIRPVNYQERYKNQQTRLVFTQQRPPEDDPDLLQGNYLYESLRPSKKWAGRHLLIPPDPDPPLRAPKPRSVYHPITAGGANEQLHTADLLQSISPTLIYSNMQGTAVPLHISVDGEHYFSTMLFGPSGRLRLPPLAIGRHYFDVTVSDKVTVLMNHLKREEPGYKLRFATHLPEDRLSFEYMKRSTDLDRLSFLFFSSSTIEPSTIRVTLKRSLESERVVTTNQFTLTNRRFEISPTETAPVHVLNNNGSTLGDGQRFLFPIGADIPPGTYQIEVNLESGPDGYLILSRVIPGSFSYRSLAKEPHITETQNEPSG